MNKDYCNENYIKYKTNNNYGIRCCCPVFVENQEIFIFPKYGNPNFEGAVLGWSPSPSLYPGCFVVIIFSNYYTLSLKDNDIQLNYYGKEILKPPEELHLTYSYKKEP